MNLKTNMRKEIVQSHSSARNEKDGPDTHHTYRDVPFLQQNKDLNSRKNYEMP